MTIQQLFDTLNNINGFRGKVAYNAFPERSAPAMPFICFMVEDYEILFADNSPYFTSGNATVELYTDERELEQEAAVEASLISAGLSFNKQVDYIDEEKCYMTTYKMPL